MVWEVKTVTNTTTNQRQIRSGVETSIVEDFLNQEMTELYLLT